MLDRLLIVTSIVALTLALAWVWKRREGRLTESSGRFDPAEIGVRSKRPAAVLVEFYGEGCAPCVVLQKRIEKVSADVPDTEIVTVDAGARLELAERYGVKRVPTLFVTDGSLRIRWRASGVPAEESIRAALLGPDWAGRPDPEQAPATR